MQISQRNLTRIMKITDLSIRKCKLQDMLLSLGWHGGVFHTAEAEYKRLDAMGIKTPLENHFAKLKEEGQF